MGTSARQPPETRAPSCRGSPSGSPRRDRRSTLDVGGDHVTDCNPDDGYAPPTPHTTNRRRLVLENGHGHRVRGVHRDRRRCRRCGQSRHERKAARAATRLRARSRCRSEDRAAIQLNRYRILDAPMTYTWPVASPASVAGAATAPRSTALRRRPRPGGLAVPRADACSGRCSSKARPASARRRWPRPWPPRSRPT